VLIGITAATAVVHAFSVVLGAVLGVALPTRLLTVLASVAFFGFAVWTIRGDTLDDGDLRAARRSTRSVVIAASVAFFLAELGDKTMLATVTLATKKGLIGRSSRKRTPTRLPARQSHSARWLNPRRKVA
jgi:Ca2+/H+ antiporter, TMEM165/GDT1 family